MLPVFPVGTGLGNRLFHWCDSKIYSYQTGCNFISPRWCRVSLGKHLRALAKGRLISEPLIEYANVFRRLPGDVSYQRGAAHSLLLTKISLSKYPAILANPIPPDTVICFDKSDYTFEGYDQHRCSLSKHLFCSLRLDLRAKILSPGEPFIGIHVRIGDGFKPPEREADGFIRTGWLQQTPIQWFKETLRLVRSVTGFNYPAYIFSDGHTAVLQPLLKEGNVFVFKSKNAVIDLFSLSRAWLILGSGSSSFSAFAAFLGSAHSFTAPGHPFTNMGLLSSKHQILGSLNPREEGAGDCLRSLPKPVSLAS